MKMRQGLSCLVSLVFSAGASAYNLVFNETEQLGLLHSIVLKV